MRKLLVLLLVIPTVTFAQNSWINIQYLSDNYPSEISWEVLDGYGSVVIESDSNYILNSLLDTTITLPSGNYTLNVNDVYGDGLGASLFGGTDGWFFVRNDCQDTIAFVEGDFGFLYTDTLTIAPCAPPAPPVLGCTNILAINFDSLATIDNGSCFFIEGCTNINAINYDSTAVIDNYTCIFTYGCTDVTALNYDSIAYINNGTCEYPLSGCTDLVSNNYNPWAVLDDGSCLASTICDPALQHSITMTIRLDNWPSETSWIMLTDNDTIDTSPPGTYDYGDIGVTLSYDFCINNTAGFEFILQDEYGDGMAGNGNPGAEGAVVIYDCDGDTITYLSSNTWVDNNGDTVGVAMGGYPNGKYASSGIHLGTPCTGVVTLDGCTDPLYQEYDVLATNDDGSCTNLHILGCTDPASFNYDPLATAMDIKPVCYYTLAIEDDGADGWGNSFLGILQGTNTWEFTTGPGNLTDTFYLNLETNKPIKVYYFEIKSGQQSPQQLAFQTLQNSFTLTNTDGDILLQEGTNPFVNNSAGALKAFEGPIWHTYDALPYCGDSCEPTILGCMDLLAFNYDSLANTNDGCIAAVYGCTNDLAFNYDSLANTDDGLCESINNGCMDTVADNYNAAANTDDGSCYYIGCTDILAYNYDSTATVNNGCIFPVYGCTDPLSTNFDPLATEDDTTCIPYVYGCTDATMFNYNPIANTDDGSCIMVVNGCTDATMWNYSDSANIDNGSCLPYVYGCTDSTAFNYSALANTDNGTCDPYIYGCTDSTAINYDPLANTTNNSCISYIYGCIDSSATNYNPLANTDDGSCIETIYGCTDSTMFNYNVSANTNDGSCIPYVYGCTDPTMFNYAATANADDNSCIPYIYGCTDFTMFNYNPLANTDNNSCIPIINGCTDSLALNFDPLANTDNGSCILPISGCTEVAAYNYDPLANTSDSTACLYEAVGCVTGLGEPIGTGYWLNDGCFAWVIDVDDYCCTNDWDASCQSMYDYCQLGWPTSIEDISVLGIVVYPNPTNDIITIETRLEIEVELYDIMGKLLISKDSKRIDLSNYPSGVYSLILIYNNKRFNTRVIKQ